MDNSHDFNKPMAWAVMKDGECLSVRRFEPAATSHADGVQFVPLYTTPPQRTWVGMMRGIRVDGHTVVISVKGGNDAARELCAYFIDEMN